MVKILAPGESAKTKRVFSVLAGIVRPVMNGLIGRSWKGFENLPQGGYIVCPNHLTEIDPLVVGHAIYSNGRLPRWLAKESLFKPPVLGWFLRTTGQVPVSRSSASAAESLKQAQKVLDAGGVIVIYPEGTLTRDPNLWPMIGRTGAARLALQTGAPVVPMAHWGDQELLPRYSKKMYLFPRKHVTVSVGTPVNLDDLREGPRTRTVLQEATNRIMDAITGLQAELREEEPPAKRWDPSEHGQAQTGRSFEKPDN
ncbi:lysophospholipid acyltransferase family protein [Glutamicibacter halophytocola]|uniref:1-acyl-sn-glycerol-3-phosphate acyltransferase n=2 Tax=Glutamicibacter halophytocola TaxID=1933880 RepID=A0AA94XYY4_9MICC|nr:lysophospholipid acyltransferase family protein [Glutamicibacter halophytocola]UUX60407.1 1-acyl-sn-glycerol-3-phosphate acyltransferase [Glutamicibacter halophytocola]